MVRIRQDCTQELCHYFTSFPSLFISLCLATKFVQASMACRSAREAYRPLVCLKHVRPLSSKVQDDRNPENVASPFLGQTARSNLHGVSCTPGTCCPVASSALASCESRPSLDASRQWSVQNAAIQQACLQPQRRTPFVLALSSSCRGAVAALGSSNTGICTSNPDCRSPPPWASKASAGHEHAKTLRISIHLACRPSDVTPKHLASQYRSGLLCTA